MRLSEGKCQMLLDFTKCPNVADIVEKRLRMRAASMKTKMAGNGGTLKKRGGKLVNFV